MRQPTATQGLDGVNENCTPSPTTVIECSLPSKARSSYAVLIPPMPAPNTMMFAMALPPATRRSPCWAAIEGLAIKLASSYIRVN